MHPKEHPQFQEWLRSGTTRALASYLRSQAESCANELRAAVARGEISSAQRAGAYLDVYEQLAKELSTEGNDTETRDDSAPGDVEFRHPHSRRRNVRATETDGQ